MDLKITKEKLEKKIKNLEHEITELKRPDNDLLLYQEILKNMAEGVCLVSTSDASIVYANEKFEKMLGYRPGELAGKPVEIVNYEDEKESAIEIRDNIIEQLRCNGEATYEIRNKKKDGTYMWCSATTSEATLPEYGNVWVAVHKDITGQKHSESELFTTKNLLKSIFDNALLNISVKDLNGRYMHVNRAFEKNFDIKSDEIFGKTDYDLLPLEDANKFQKEETQLIKTNQLLQKEIQFSLNNEVQYYSVNKFPINGENGKSFALGVISENITERKIAEIKLKESREILYNFMDSATDGFILLDSQLYHLEINRRALEITGLKRKNVIGKNLLDTVPNIKETDRYDEYLKVIKTGTPFYISDLISHPLTPDKHINLKAFKVGDGIGFIFTDITEQKKAEEELKKIFELTPDMICKANIDGYFRKLNPAWEETLGFSLKELISKPFKSFIHPDDQTRTKKELERQFSGKPSIKFENRYRCKNGSYIPLEWNATSASTDGTVYAVARDITDRKRMEKILKNNEKKYRSLFNNMIQGVFYQTSNGKIIDCNQAVLNQFGLTRDQFMDLTFMDPYWKVIREDGSDCPGDQQPSMKSLQSGKTVWNEILGVFNPRKNKYIWLSINAIPQFKQDKKTPYQVFVTLHDISDRKQLELKQNQINQTLEKKVEERASELQEMNTALKVLLKKRDADKKELEEKIFTNYKTLITPFLDKLKNTLTTRNQKNLMNILESNLEEFSQPFSQKLSNPMVNLTPTEIQIASMIKQGLTNKEIAQTLNNSIRTITNHRQHIRLKLDLKNKKINLRSFLSTL